jgi:hypothetical protein
LPSVPVTSSLQDTSLNTIQVHQSGGVLNGNLNVLEGFLDVT